MSSISTIIANKKPRPLNKVGEVRHEISLVQIVLFFTLSPMLSLFLSLSLTMCSSFLCFLLPSHQYTQQINIEDYCCVRDSAPNHLTRTDNVTYKRAVIKGSRDSPIRILKQVHVTHAYACSTEILYPWLAQWTFQKLGTKLVYSILYTPVAD